MTAQMFLWLVAAILAGVVLIAAGLRGRRVNRNPCCRQCGFDLTGVLPSGVTCPECGAGVKLAKYVRIGQRRRLYSLIVLGVPMAILPLMPLSIVLFTTMTRTDLGKYKPLPLLLWEAQNLAEEDVRLAVKQILDRQTRGVLTELEYARVLEAMTLVHRDESKTWTAEWGDVVARARLDGKLDKEALADFYAAAGVIEWSCRATVRAGEKLPIVGKLKQTRLAPSMEAMSLQFIEKATIGGRSVRDFKAPKSEQQGNVMFSRSTNSVQSIVMMGGAPNPWYGYEPQLARFTQTIPADLPPGEYVLDLEVAQAGQAFDMNRWQAMSSDEFRWTRKQRAMTVRVVRPDEAVVRQLPATEALSATIASQVAPTTQVYDSGGAGGRNLVSSAMITFSVAACKTPLACKVYYRVGDSRKEIGTLTTGAGGVDPFGGSMFGAQMFSYATGGGWTLSFPIPAEMIDKDGEVLLVPDVALAEQTPDLSEIYGGEIVIPGVRFSMSDITYNATGVTTFTTPNVTQAEGDEDAKSEEAKATPKKKGLLELIFSKDKKK